MRHIPCFTLLAVTGCYRPSDVYGVHVYGSGTDLEEVLPRPVPMGGMIEYARFRFWGTNLGHGLTGLYGDAPRADGTTVTVGYGYFGYPADDGFDRNSSFLSPGPPLRDGDDTCYTRITISGYFSFMEYVDVGDHIAFDGPEGGRAMLERDPSTHNRPAGESWYVGYGGRLMPEVVGHDLLPDNWASDATWSLSFPGTIPPPDATLGAIPYPLEGVEARFPTALDGLALGGEPFAPPGAQEVRLPGPWDGPVELTWAPSADGGEPVTVVLRYLGWGDEGSCDCNTHCGAGFTCRDGLCVGDEGSGWHVLGELACTAADDGSFTLDPALLETLDRATDPNERAGFVLAAARLSEGTVEVADALTYNGKRVVVTPVRTRLADIAWTRLEAP